MRTVFSWKDADGNHMTVTSRPWGGVVFATGPRGSYLNDAEIPDLVAALQDYMSRRAREMAKAGKEGRR